MVGENCTEADSLWIEFLLLPSKLDEHLASLDAGIITKPSHIDLLLVFLDRAILSHKITPSSTLNKLDIAISVSNAEGKAALLCRLAAKVWMASQLSLPDIESIPSLYHQFLLLKALIKYDDTNSLLHQCQLHQWILHNVLKPHAARTTCSRRGGSLTSLQRGLLISENAPLVLASEGYDTISSGENDSITFIENVLGLSEGDKDNSNQVVDLASQSFLSDINGDSFGVSHSNPSILSDAYQCQLLMDLGEVHFMRGKIFKAHRLFSICGKKLEDYVIGNQFETLHVPISKDRLVGFIIACRMVLGMHLFTMQNIKVELFQEIGIDKPPLQTLESPSSSDYAVIACEQSRWLLRSKWHSHVLPCKTEQKITLDLGDVFSSLEESENTSLKASHMFPLLMELMADNVSNMSCEKNTYNEHVLLEDVSHKCLIDAFVHDLFRGHLKWGYRISLENDPSIPPMTQSLLIGCNALRSIIVGCQVESFLRISDRIGNNMEAIQFLLKMIAGCMRGGETILLRDADGIQSKRRKLDDNDKETLASRLHQFVRYICCVIDKSWCWKLAHDLQLLTDKEIKTELVEGVVDHFTTPDSPEKDNVGAFFSLMQAENVHDCEAILKKNMPLFSQETVAAPCDRMQVNLEQEPISRVDFPSKCIANILRQKAYDAIVCGSQYKLAKYLCSQALLHDPENCDSNLMQWLLCKLAKERGELQIKSGQADNFASSKFVAFTLQNLINEELWENVQEMCTWLTSFTSNTLNDMVDNDGNMKRKAEKLILFGKVAKAIVHLCIFSSSMKENTEASEIGPVLCHPFEEFLCHLFNVGRLKDMEVSHPSISMMPFILNISNLNVIKLVATFAVGWLQRFHLAGLTPWPKDIERYGVLANIMAGVPIASTAGSSKSVSLRISLDSVRDLLRMLLERIVNNTDIIDCDIENGHIWMQGLADLAYEDKDHVQALQYYLQAGAARSACYCDRTSSMPRDIFTPWIISRMIESCRAIGAGFQAVILCQCLPVPNLDLAFQILQESVATTEKDVDLYAECIWEVPILELLIHLYSKSGDGIRVGWLISVLQQPALNIHNPLTVRKCHIQVMQQRFLQQFYDEIL